MKEKLKGLLNKEIDWKMTLVADTCISIALSIAVFTKHMKFSTARYCFYFTVVISIIMLLWDFFGYVTRRANAKNAALFSIGASGVAGLATAIAIINVVLTHMNALSILICIGVILCPIYLILKLLASHNMKLEDFSPSADILTAMALVTTSIGLTIATYLSDTKTGNGNRVVLEIHRQYTYGHSSTTEWMTAWGTIIGAVGGLSALLTFGMQYWKDQQRKSIPPADLHRVLSNFQESLREIAGTGKESRWFLDSEQKQKQLEVESLVLQVFDLDLKAILSRILDQYTQCFAMSAGHGQLNSPENLARRQRQIVTANEGLNECTAAHTRIVKLMSRR